MAAGTRPRPQFHLDQRIAFNFGTRKAKGSVVEDRGPLGVGGQRIYRIRLDMDPFEPVFLELPENELEPFSEAEPPITPHEALEYLANGGLMLMLQSGATGTSPRIWLRRDNLGNVTHTFVEGRGTLGGAVPPVYCFHDDRVFSGKREEVVQFLMSFGLSTSDANSVIDEIGTKP